MDRVIKHPTSSLNKETNFLLKCWHVEVKWNISTESDLL